jgi:nuclear pore complex protein Nup205
MHVLGKTVINGKSVAVNQPFAKQAIFISTQLDASERYISSLVHKVMSDNPNIDGVTCVELSIEEFHRRRRYLVDTIKGLLELAELADQAGPGTVYERIDAFVTQELAPSMKVPQNAPTESTWGQRIFRELENLSQLLTSTDLARKSAKSVGVAPGGQGMSSLSYFTRHALISVAW